MSSATEAEAGGAPHERPDPVGAGWRAIIAALTRLPQGALSRGAGRLAEAPIPRGMRRRVLTTFANAVGIDLAEVELPLEAYGSIGDFFVRRLREGARDWPEDPRVLASPVDGVIGRTGTIARGRALQAKGRDYSVAEMLGDAEAGERYDGGTFITIYLSPRHYHRIHAPCAGEIPLARHVPGALLPVNAAAVSSVADLFARNERLICWIDGALGRVAVVAVGAYNVGRISASFEQLAAERGAPSGRAAVWRTNLRGASGETRRYEPALPVRQGEEIMAFHLGSTVVMLLEPGRVAPFTGLVAGAEVRAGAELTRSIALNSTEENR